MGMSVISHVCEDRLAAMVQLRNVVDIYWHTIAHDTISYSIFRAVECCQVSTAEAVQPTQQQHHIKSVT